MLSTNHYLGELEQLAKRHSARIVITLEGYSVTASCKMPGIQDTVIDYQSPAFRYSPEEGVNGVLYTLLQRLGWQGAPTSRSILENMTPAQRTRLAELIAELKQLRNVALGHSSEPRLASPQSSLHPSRWLGEADDDE